MKKQRNIAINMEETDYRAFKAKLAYMGKTVGSWFEEQIKDFIKEVNN